MDNKLKATEEQLAYARLLDMGMKAGLLLLIITFLIYLTAIIKPYIPRHEVSQYWGYSVHKYLEVTGIQPGWSWLNMIGKSDFMNFIGIAFLAGVTVICYIRIIPILFRKNDRVYAFIAILEVLVLVLAASGILKSGGH
jgi:hypothetical protein